MTDTPRYKLELSLTDTARRFGVAVPTLIHDEVISQAWGMMNVLVEDVLDNLGIEATDEQFREIFIEICYRLIFREMTTLLLLPIQERNVMKRIANAKPREKRTKSKKGDTNVNS